MTTPDDSMPISSDQLSRLQEKRDLIEHEWKLRHEKLAFLWQELAIEASAQREFELQKRIEAEEAALADLEAELETLESQLKTLESQQRSRTLQNLPYSGVVAFVGREEELDQIHSQLQSRSQVAISAIAGMGGIGKTELALQYARKHCHEGSYPGGLCWVRAREEVGTQIISFARSLLNLTLPDDLELVEKVRWCCWGRWREGEVLLVLDDVQDYNDVKSFLPPQESRFKVLMTSRSYFGPPVQELRLDVLSEEKALDLLRSLVPDGRIEQDSVTAKQVCEWLGYLPLGLELVGRHLARKKGLSIAEL